MKILGMAGLALVCFLLALIVPIAATGNLPKLGQLVGRKPPEQPVELKEEPDQVTPLVRALRLREEKLDEREAQIKEEEERVRIMRADLEQLRTDLKDIQQQIGLSLQAADVDREERLQEVATSLSKMKPKNAAKTLDEWPPSDVAGIMLRIKDKERSKIFDEMTPDKAAVILQAIQEDVL